MSGHKPWSEIRPKINWWQVRRRWRKWRTRRALRKLTQESEKLPGGYR